MNDIPAMQVLFAGKARICGGLDVQNVIDLNGVTEEEIRAETLRCIEQYGRGGGYTLYCATVGLLTPKSYQPGGNLHTVIDKCKKYEASL